MRMPRWYLSRYGARVRDAVDSGELTFRNIREWEIRYNGGIEPYPDMGTREIMKFYLSRKGGTECR